MADEVKWNPTKVRRALPLAVPVHVQCGGFRCLAYRDKRGNWINYHTGECIEGPVRVIVYHLD
jgi:hypothetical protein